MFNICTMRSIKRSLVELVAPRLRFAAVSAAITIAAMPLCDRALSQTASQILREAKQAERTGAHRKAFDLYSTLLGGDSLSNAERRELLKRRAYLNERFNQVENALEDWSNAIEIEPVDPTLFASRGFLFLRMRLYDEPDRILQEGTRSTQSHQSMRMGWVAWIPIAETTTRR